MNFECTMNILIYPYMVCYLGGAVMVFVELEEDDVNSKRLVSSLFHFLSLSLTLYPLLIITTDKLLTILLLL